MLRAITMMFCFWRLNAYLFRLEDQQFAPTGAYEKLYKNYSFLVW
jgi:hypothetical protein